MKKYFYLLGALLGAFVLGIYCTSQFKYNSPIEPHRWVITSLVMIGFAGAFIAQTKKDGNN